MLFDAGGEEVVVELGELAAGGRGMGVELGLGVGGEAEAEGPDEAGFVAGEGVGGAG